MRWMADFPPYYDRRRSAESPQKLKKIDTLTPMAAALDARDRGDSSSSISPLKTTIVIDCCAGACADDALESADAIISGHTDPCALDIAALERLK